MFVYMLTHPNAAGSTTPRRSDERWLVGAAPMPTAQLEEFERKFGGTMYVGYGLDRIVPRRRGGSARECRESPAPRQRRARGA